MKAYKSLDAYNFFVSGWVNGVLAKELEGEKVLLVCTAITKGKHRFPFVHRS